jgi:hypothetical protein
MEEILMDFNDVTAVKIQEIYAELNNRGPSNSVDSSMSIS